MNKATDKKPLTKKILVVEDERAYSELLVEQLTKRGYQVSQANDGQLGLDAAKREKPDLILLDIRMPMMGGMTMLNLLRKEKAGKKTKVILLTNLEPDQKILGGVMRDQPVHYFVKSDISFHELLDKITELLVA